MMSETVKLQCACMSARRMARVITRMYAEELRGLMEPTQFGLLQAISQVPECTQTKLIRLAGYEKTTLSRDLVRMKEKGWVSGGRGGVKLTSSGSAMLKKALPHWQRAQKNLKASLGEEIWKAMFELSEFIADDSAEAA